MEYFWLAVALVILLLLLRKPFKEQVLGALDARAERIRRELDEAQRLHEEAKALLARYQRQLHEGETLAREILERVDVEQRRLEARMREEVKAMTDRRTQQALERIAQEEARAVQEVRARAAELAVRATRELLAERLQGELVQELMRKSVAEVQAKLG
ncbi:MAG: F0F1 ATP synthase subunit B [Geminicoccaceae bacterium]|nr:F0F1 ATP synthase subunit B [Geminicoccaceae bacterium]MCX8099954.1 F0F1 ATP synthase subunit B [Geminicoccaceae bacterium]MDW8369533.1 F0F1 ATP synthase subunit B [Geminicoccaceae bacterium]